MSQPLYNTGGPGKPRRRKAPRQPTRSQPPKPTGVFGGLTPPTAPLHRAQRAARQRVVRAQRQIPAKPHGIRQQAGPPTDPAVQHASLVTQVARNRLRLGIHAQVQSSRSVNDLANELMVLRQTVGRRHSTYLGLKHVIRHYDKQTGRPVPINLSNPRSPWYWVSQEADVHHAAIAAPALKVLEQTTRPLHGIAGGVDAALHGRNVLSAVGRGLANKDKTTFSDLTGHGPLGTALGFGLDVALDPTTYVTGGLGGVEVKAAEEAAAAASRRALALGLTEDQAARFGQRAFTQAARTAGESRGIVVRAGGRELPGVRRGTAAAARGGRRAANRVGVARKISDAGRHVGADFNPNIVPDGAGRATYEGIRMATRTARSTSSREIYKVRLRAAAVDKAIGKDNYRQVLDAIESGTVRHLPDKLQAPARFLQAQFKYARRVERQAGIRGATRKNYVPHVRRDLLENPGRGMGQESVGARSIRPSSSRARKDQRTLAEIRATDPKRYVEDPGLLYTARLSESAVARSRAALNRGLLQHGRRLRQGRPLDLARGEAVFHIKGSDVRELDLSKKVDQAEVQRYIDGSARRGGQYVALNAQAVHRALKTVMPGGERSAIGRGLDRAQGTWKTLATQPNPGFHVRNLLGDAQNAYLAQSAPSLARSLRHSARALRVLGRQEEAARHLGRVIDPSGKGLRIGGKHMSYEQLVAEAEKVGGVRSGFVSRELHDLLDGKMAKVGSRGERLRRWTNNREDVIRLATYIGARKRGLSAEQAAAHVAKYHFDYSDLTELERRVMRRVMPFYTFSARNIPLQFKSILTRPGKYAQYEKIREELAKAFGYQDNWEGDLSPQEQRSVPLPIRIGGKKITISLGPGGLPLTDLNEFPATANPVKQADEWINRAMSLVTPAIKTPVELWSNMSFFFRAPIERPEGPLVPAPTWVARIPASYRRKLGIVPDYVDRRSGKKQWGWPAKLGYAFGVLPGPASFLNRVLTPSEQHDWKSKTLGYAGIRAIPVDPVSTKIDNLYQLRDQVDKKMRALNQRGVSATSPNADYVRLSAQEKDITSHIMALRTKRGDKIIPGASQRRSSMSSDAQQLLKGLQSSKPKLSRDAQSLLQGIR